MGKIMALDRYANGFGITEKEREKIIALHKQGLDNVTLAARFGVGRSAIGRILRVAKGGKS